MTELQDWHEWHTEYEDPDSALSWRLDHIQKHIRDELDRLPAGPIRVVSLVAGQSRDLIGAASGHPRSKDLVARTVELDERNVEVGRQLLAESGLSGIDLVAGDASESSAYAGIVPAELILAVGLLGNLRFNTLPDVIERFKSLSAEGALIIWTFHRHPPDQTSTVRKLFVDAGWEELSFQGSPVGPQVVGVNRLPAQPTPFQGDLELFDFVGYRNLSADELPH